MSRPIFVRNVSEISVHYILSTDDMFSPSAQCTDAVNKARRLIFMIRRSFQDLSKPAFISLYGALVRPHFEYGMPAYSPNLVADINHLERIQRLATSLVTGMRHLPYEERLQRRRLRADLITAFKIFTAFWILIRTCFSSLPLDAA